MLQSTPFSKVYGHGHIKKFWLMQNQRETENKALLASSTSRNNGSLSGLGNESKQGPQFSVGNANTRTLTTPPGLPVRPLISGPACFNIARHTSLVTCAESLSPSSRTDQSRSLIRSPSPNTSSSSSKEGNCYSAGDGEGMSSPRTQDVNSAYTHPWGSSFGFGDQLVRDFRAPLIPKEESFDAAIDCSSPCKDPQLNSMSLQDGYHHGKTSDDDASKKGSSGPSKCSLGFFSELETVTPFAMPFQLPEKYFLEAEKEMHDGEAAIKVNVHKTSAGTLHPIKNAVPSNSSGRTEFFGAVEGEARKGDGLCSSVLRTCTVCGTSKTPLWRSGPQGPKSLCNACGIRFKKARRGSTDSADCRATSLTSPKSSVKRKQDVPLVNVDTHLSTALVTNGVATQVVKKRRWSQVVRKGENCEVTASSNESSLTCNLRSPSAVSSPSVSHFERLSIYENSTALSIGAGKDEEEAAVLLMYMSWGLVFA